MTKMNFAKGIGLGLVIGSAMGMVIPRPKSSRKKTVARALRTVGDVIENVSDAMGF